MAEEFTVQPCKNAQLSEAQLSLLDDRLAEERRALLHRMVELESEVVAGDDCYLTDAAEAVSQQENRLRACGLMSTQFTIYGLAGARRLSPVVQNKLGLLL